MSKNNLLLSISAAGIILSGCGGGGSSSSPALPNQIISGNVIDGAVKESRVSLDCGNDNIYNAITKTNENGAFTIRNIPGSQNLSECMIIAKGGEDTSDGDDLTGLVLKSNYALFNEKTGLVVSPLTNTVATIDSSSDDLEAAKEKAAKFLGIEKDDLKKNPISQVKLAKIAKKLTKIAKAKKKDGNSLGFIDLDDTSSQNVDSFVENSDSLTDENKTVLKENIELIDDATDVKDIVRQSIATNALALLKKAYKQNTYTKDQKRNLKILAKEIAKANVKDDKQQIVTRYHVRKALNDLGLLPEFKVEEKEVDGKTLKLSTTELVDALLTNLNLEEVEFKKLLVDDKNVSKIAIKDISGIILYDSDTYESVLGDDMTKRREYYAFSDKSIIAKLQELASDSYSDTINDTINEKTSLGLANLGFNDMALENVADNIYQSEEQQDAYHELGRNFLTLNLKDYASKAFLKEYDAEKRTIEEVTFEFYRDKNKLPRIASYLSRSGNDKKAQEILDFMLTWKSSVKDIYGYGNLIYAHENVSEEYYINSNNIEKAKENAKRLIDIVNNMPVNYCESTEENKKRFQSSFALYYPYRSVINTLMYGNDSTGLNELLEKWKTTAEACYTGIYDRYYAQGKSRSAMPIAYKGLSGDIDGAIKDFDAAVEGKSKYAYDALITHGFDAALVINNKEDLLFNTYFKNDEIFTTRSKYYKAVIKAAGSVNLGVSPIFLATPYVIKINAGDEKLESYLDKMKNFLDSYNYTEDDDIADVYGVWNEYTNNSKKGYLALAKFYKDLGETEKAEAIFTKAVEKVSSMAASVDKIVALYNINLAMNELSLGSTSKEALLSALNTTSLDENMTDITEIMKAVTILAGSGEIEKAKAIVERAYTLVPKLPQELDLDVLKDRKIALIGEYSYKKHEFQYSIANGYFQTGNKAKAKEIIVEALNTINTLEETVDKYKHLIDVAVAYGSINELSLAKAIFPQIKTTKEHTYVITNTAEALANFDAFLFNDAASVDSDGDLKPDFWNINATQEQIDASIAAGTVLDEDIDNDGKDDDKDTLPYDNI